MSEELIYQKLDNIEKLLVEQSLLKKEVLNFNETAIYLEVSHSHLYKLPEGPVPCGEKRVRPRPVCEGAGPRKSPSP